MTLCITSLHCFDRLADFLASLSLDDLGPTFWADDVGDAVWHHTNMVAG
jgi:hypothetical protein